MTFFIDLPKTEFHLWKFSLSNRSLGIWSFFSRNRDNMTTTVAIFLASWDRSIFGLWTISYGAWFDIFYWSQKYKPCLNLRSPLQFFSSPLIYGEILVVEYDWTAFFEDFSQKFYFQESAKSNLADIRGRFHGNFVWNNES